jgi:hypothetical protein
LTPRNIFGGQVLLFAIDPKKRGKKQDLTPITLALAKKYYDKKQKTRPDPI